MVFQAKQWFGTSCCIDDYGGFSRFFQEFMETFVPKRLSQSIDLFCRQPFGHPFVFARIIGKFGSIGGIWIWFGNIEQVQSQTIAQYGAVWFLIQLIREVVFLWGFVIYQNFIFGKELFAFWNTLYRVTGTDNYSYYNKCCYFCAKLFQMLGNI